MSNTGNTTFTGISTNSALQQTNASVNQFSANTANVRAGLQVGRVVQNTAVGYVTSAFSTLPLGTPLTLVASPANVNSPATAATALTLPQNAIVTGVYVDNAGTTITGGTTFNLGLGTLGGAATTIPILTAALLATINAGLLYQVGGTIAVGGVAPTSGTANLYVNVASTANVTAGNMRVYVSYIVLA
jgi:hypothetical protein